MTDIETTVENARAQYHYPPIRTAILPSDADELQLQLADRLHRHRHQHALEVIADLGRVFDAEEALPAIEALGRLLVHASLLAGCERMAIAPIIALGRELTRDSGVSSELPLKPAAVLAHVALNHWREPADVVRGMAMAIAKAIDDCEIVHELKIDPLELFKVAAREMLDGVAYPRTSKAISGVQVVDKAAMRAEAWAELRKAAGGLIGMGDEEAAERSAFMDEAAAAGVPKEAFERRCVPDPDGSPLGWSWPVCPPGHRPETHDEVRERIKAGLRKANGAVVADVGVAAAMVGVQYEVAEDGMGGEEQIPIPIYEAAPSVFHEHVSVPLRPKTWGAPDCPGCGAQMSPVSGSPGEWICSKDHRK